MQNKENKISYEDRTDFGVEENNDFNQDGYAYKAKPLSRGQKLAVGVLAFFAFLLIIFQFVSFKDNINKPFEYKGNNNNASEDSICSGSDCPSAVANLRAQDTDGDGLNDYDELNIYKTSPYLEDSDSDGFSDFEEINNEKDPNCPSGRDCYDTAPLVNISAEDENDLDIESLQKTFNQNESTGQGISGQTENIDLKNIPEELENIDAETLRALLLESGVEEGILNQISDEDLLSTFEEVLGAE